MQITSFVPTLGLILQVEIILFPFKKHSKRFSFLLFQPNSNLLTVKQHMSSITSTTVLFALYGKLNSQKSTSVTDDNLLSISILHCVLWLCANFE